MYLQRPPFRGFMWHLPIAALVPETLSGDAMQTAADPDVERAWTRGLILLAVLFIAALLTRCPVADLHDTPVPPPSSYGGR
jgi:hypothetical protein